MFSKAPPLGFGPLNYTEKPSHHDAPSFSEEWGGGALHSLGNKIHPSGPRAGDKVLSLQP